MPDILLATINAKWIHPSLALRLLKANLGIYEDRAEIMEFALRQPPEEKIAPILKARPRIVGFSVSIWNHRATLELLRALDALWGQAPEPGVRPVVVLGGPEVSYLPEESEIFRHARWVIRGEGEGAFRDLCGMILAGAGDVPARKFIDAAPADLSVIDPGYRLYTAEDLSRKLIYVEASRGCPFGCEFCLSSAERVLTERGPAERRPPAEAPAVREFPLDRFLENMEDLIRRGGRAFKFLDRTFNLNIPRARRIMEFFLERQEPSLYVHFEMVPARFPPELRETLTRFPPGRLRLELGIQTLNRECAARIGRRGDPEQELEVLEFLRRETHAIVHADLIAGLPGEDLASFGEGFDRLWQVRPAEIQLGILKCLPGTAISRHNKPWGMRYAPDPPYEVMESAVLPAGALDGIKNFARFWELIVNRGAFADLGDALFPEGQPLFTRFMAMADWLLQRFRRNWGIDRKDLRAALEEWAAGRKNSINLTVRN
ncbi:MAG: radical SAM protein [Treponema sp.]|jgi:radical SAM superfamily enzyme YgiQ (UPF0313 family)|nr:radical SAM protein [Treponema sp.]